MNIDVVFSEANQANMDVDFSESTQMFDAELDGLTVLNGATFTPNVSKDGVISWTNDKELPNPEPVNIKGDKGEQGSQGKDGAKGDKGDTGKDGTPCTHRWSGTTLYVTSASGTTSANLKGERGEQGVRGADGQNGKDGKDGYTPVKGVDYFDGVNGIDGRDGSNGKDGVDGYTPIKGVDYYTEADKAEMVSAVLDALYVEQWTFTLEDGSTVTKKVVVV